MIRWFINGDPFADHGLTLVAGNFRTHAVSELTLRRAVNFDAAEFLAYNADAVITYTEEIDGTASVLRQQARGCRE